MLAISHCRWPALWALGTLALVCSSPCEQLPLRAYGVADGLASNDVNAIRKDSRGFLWFATREGLSRFDGYEFDTYGRANGLSRDWITDFLQTRSGVYWAATPDGVFRFDPSAPASKQFTAYRAATPGGRRVFVLHEDRAGQVWCGAEDGLYRIRPASGVRGGWQLESVSMDSAAAGGGDRRVIVLFEDSRGVLWIGTFNDLYRRTPDGRFERDMHFPDTERWLAISEDRQGRLWGGRATGLWRILFDGAGGYRYLPVFVPRKTTFVWQILEAPGGTLWLATSSGLGTWVSAPDGLSGQARLYGVENGLAVPDVESLETDREGNLWLGTADGGAMRLARHGFVSYGKSDGLTGEEAAPTLFRDRAGEVRVAFHHVLKVKRGEKFISIVPAIPAKIRYLGWGWHQSALQDHTGEWWFSTGEGLVRFPNVPIQALGRTRPKSVYTRRDGLRTDEIFRIFEDSRGDVWIACIGPRGVNGLSRWNRGSNSIQSFDIPVDTVASAFAEDREGSVWIGFYTGELCRFRAGSFRCYGSGGGLAGGGIRAVHADRTGRLWIASLRGITRVEGAATGHPIFRHFGTEDGLSSNVILCLTEDRWGRLYLATARGIDRVEPDGEIAPGRVRHYTAADGLATGELRDVLVDRNGVLWCASSQGVSRFVPEPDPPRTAPPVLLRALRVRGVAYPVVDSGATVRQPLELAPNQNQLQFDFTGLVFANQETVRYQYKLEPVDRSWSTPSEQRSVNYSNISPGRYRFAVRLITAEGARSDQPAAIAFSIRADFWQQWWFRLLAALVVASLMYLLHRYRTMRVIELERVRTRIAADLHDDIGAGLSQIAVLSEVARTRLDEREPELKSVLANIGAVSRELAESMSDIVWSVNPERDHISDLLQRMRRFGSDVLSARNIDFRFRIPGAEQQLRIGTEVRREVYLIFKEGINNLLRHSGCTHAEIEVSIDGGWFELRVEDNGGGLGGNGNQQGQGLKSMSERARRLGGEIAFQPAEGGGLRLSVRVPIRSSAAPGVP